MSLHPWVKELKYTVNGQYCSIYQKFEAVDIGRSMITETTG